MGFDFCERCDKSNVMKKHRGEFSCMVSIMNPINYFPIHGLSLKKVLIPLWAVSSSPPLCSFNLGSIQCMYTYSGTKEGWDLSDILFRIINVVNRNNFGKKNHKVQNQIKIFITKMPSIVWFFFAQWFFFGWSYRNLFNNHRKSMILRKFQIRKKSTFMKLRWFEYFKVYFWTLLELLWFYWSVSPIQSSKQSSKLYQRKEKEPQHNTML